MRSTQSKGIFDDGANLVNRGGLAGPIGGAPGRRENQTNEILDSSTLTDKHKYKIAGGGPPVMVNSSVISRASALQSHSKIEIDKK
jgi:hypothetical protein